MDGPSLYPSGPTEIRQCSSCGKLIAQSYWLRKHLWIAPYHERKTIMTHRLFSSVVLILLALAFFEGLPSPTFAQTTPEVHCSKCNVSNRAVSGPWKQCPRCGKWYCPSCQGGKSTLECCQPNVSGIKMICSTCAVTSNQVSGSWKQCSACGRKYCFQCQKGTTFSSCCNKPLKGVS